MTFLKIGVAMGTGGQHEITVRLKEGRGNVATLLLDLFGQHQSQLRIEGVFSCFEELVVVNAALAPKDSLFMEDFTAVIQRFIMASPKDTVRVGVCRRPVIAHDPIVPGNGIALVIPMSWHGQGIRHQGSPKHAFLSRRHHRNRAIMICGVRHGVPAGRDRRRSGESMHSKQ